MISSKIANIYANLEIFMNRNGNMLRKGYTFEIIITINIVKFYNPLLLIIYIYYNLEFLFFSYILNEINIFKN